MQLSTCMILRATNKRKDVEGRSVYQKDGSPQKERLRPVPKIEGIICALSRLPFYPKKQVTGYRSHVNMKQMMAHAGSRLFQALWRSWHWNPKHNRIHIYIYLSAMVWEYASLLMVVERS